MNGGIYLLVGLALGMLIGGIIGWLAARGRPGASDGRLENELRQQATEREAELKQTREQLSQLGTARAAAEARQAAAEKLLAEQRALHEKALQEAKETQTKALTDLRDTFKALSADALKQTQPEFLRLANETFAKFQKSAEGDLATRQEAIKTLVEPLKQQ